MTTQLRAQTSTENRWRFMIRMAVLGVLALCGIFLLAFAVTSPQAIVDGGGARLASKSFSPRRNGFLDGPWTMDNRAVADFLVQPNSVKRTLPQPVGKTEDTPTKPPYFEAIQTATSHQPKFFAVTTERIPGVPQGELRATIEAHCELIRETVMEKWLPLARKEADGVYRTHVAFVGDSHGKQLQWNIARDLGVCVRGRWLEWQNRVACEVPFASTCVKIIYLPEVEKNRSSLETPGRQLTFSYHKIPFSKATAKALAAAYAPLYRDSNSSDYTPLMKNGFSTDSVAVLRNGERKHIGKRVPGTWLSPSLKLRAPDALVISSGSWDVQHSEVIWNGYDLYSEDVYARPDFGTYFLNLVNTLGATLRANYSVPMLALFKAWSSAWGEERFRSGNLSTLELGYAPPRTVTITAPPKIDCSGSYFRHGRLARHSLHMNQTRIDYRIFLRDPNRCEALLYPIEAVIRRVLRDTWVDRQPPVAAEEGPSAFRHNFIDWSLDENPCTRTDSTHLDHLSPICRAYVTKVFYGQF